MTWRTFMFWGGLAVLLLVAYSVGGKRGLSQRRSGIELQEASVPLQPLVQPALQYLGASPSGSNPMVGA